MSTAIFVAWGTKTLSDLGMNGAYGKSNGSWRNNVWRHSSQLIPRFLLRALRRKFPSIRTITGGGGRNLRENQTWCCTFRERLRCRVDQREGGRGYPSVVPRRHTRRISPNYTYVTKKLLVVRLREKKNYAIIFSEIVHVVCSFENQDMELR
jgi:hypothetical protein